MYEESLTRDWAESHFKMTGAIHKLVNGFWQAMEYLHRRQFSAPWNERSAG